MVSKRVFLDSSVLIALYNPLDSQHKKAKHLMKQLEQEKKKFILHPLVIIEVLTVTKKRATQEALMFCENELWDEEKFFVDEVGVSFEKDNIAIQLFNQKNKLSFLDSLFCSYAVENDLELLTFDRELEKIYKRQRRN